MNQLVSTNGIRLIALMLAAILMVGIGNFEVPASEDIQRGIRKARSGQFDVAINIWSKEIEKNPRSHAAYVNRGSAYMRSGYVFRGIMDWSRAGMLAPVFSYGVYLGDFIIEAPRNKAILNYTASLELDPDYIPSVVMMGSTLMDLGREEKAVQLFRKSIELTKNPLLKNHLEYWAASIESSSAEQ
ncbi:MAG TPA: tetratricopeptide repeat protein [Desulfomonilaceae bacterium]|nr:tetratricopeptide repeat protein [Desulfomonilaceae bacterium]